MIFQEAWENLTATERETFGKCSRRLLKQTFLVRDKDEESRKLYFYAAKNQNVLSEYFGFIGFDVVLDRDNGVVMLRNGIEGNGNGRIQSGRYRLKKDESIVLCCLWTLYADRVRSGSLARNIMVSITDLRFALEKYQLKDGIEKNRMAKILDLFEDFNLVDVEGRIGEPDCLIRLYPSLQFALDSEAFGRFVESVRERMTTKEGDIAGEEDVDEFEEES